MSKLLENGISDDEPDMEIQIKTLMGTTIDIEVSSEQTVEEIKRKIYRVEGIPVHQQTLIFQSKELKDSIKLCDAGVKEGSVLTLVTSMRGGPISTRKLSIACEHQVVLKELNKILENTRNEISPGSKVSVLVFKEGDIINLLRVIENEDGSYSPYTDKPISPPTKPCRKDTRTGVFERMFEDAQMSTRMANLRQKMADVSLRKQNKNAKSNPDTDSAEKLNSMPFQFLSECSDDILSGVDLKIFERTVEGDNQSETEEIALKDKHRTKPGRFPSPNSLFSESKGLYSHTKANYARMNKKDKRCLDSSSSETKLVDQIKPEPSTSFGDSLSILDEDSDDLYSEAVSVSARNRVHLARLILSEGAERPKSSPDGIELEENAQDLWEIHEPASERLKHSATCKVGLLKSRQRVEYGYEGIDNGSNMKSQIGNYNNSEFGLCSVSNTLLKPTQFLPTPSAIPPQYAPKDPGFCNYYFSNSSRSPLYGRKTSDELSNCNDCFKNTFDMKKNNFLEDCSSIQRLRNECSDPDIFGKQEENVDELYGYFNLACTADLSEKTDKTEEKRELVLPPVIKKRARCGECNKKLNITNIYNCRCGKIFCSQHRYSEVHHCNYDYKTEGRRILEQQNPLVTGEKIKRI